MAPAWHFDITTNQRQLFMDYPPRASEACKRLFFGLAEAPMSEVSGDVRIIRTKPASGTSGPQDHWTRIETREGFYSYERTLSDSGSEVVDWHVNFADYQLFGFYHTALFAQDEIMVAEHPILASIREYLLSLAKEKGSDYVPHTQDDHGCPTPFLILGAGRCLRINTAPAAAQGAADGLYGNKLIAVPISALPNATTVLTDPTPVNIAAMEAPHPGNGMYKATEIQNAFLTALTTFSAITETAGGANTRVHTGNWGCGAFGGNKTLMYIIQLVAADWCGINDLRFYDCDEKAIYKARGFRELIHDYQFQLSELVEYLVDREFEWGYLMGIRSLHWN